jgi:3-oxoacyl-[acyl-carrier-protein] synthase II
MSSKPTDVVVTGVGALASIGIGIDAFWTSMRNGISGIKSLEFRDDAGPKPPCGWRDEATAGHWIGGPLIGFDAAQFVRPRKALKVMGRELQTAFAASQMSMDDAGLPDAINDKLISPEHVATVFGSQMLYGPASELVEAVRNSMNSERRSEITRFGETAMRDIMPLWMLKYLPNMGACHVGISIGATGPNNTIVSGDVSATSALMESVGTLQRGAATAVICGAAGSRIDETYIIYRGDAPLPTVASDIAKSSRPHALEADGIVFGEAAAALVLESRSSAVARGKKPLAVVAGHASRFAAPEAHMRGSSRAIKLSIEGALACAGLQPSDIGLIVSHGTGDPQRDACERDALSHCLPSTPVCVPIAITGHSGSAIGAVYLVTAVLALQHETIPATPNHGHMHPSMADRTSTKPRKLTKPAVIVLTHNSQGNANAVILTRD